jgi:lipoprotein-anchoring transpeptidase ErfK/SrfK
LGKRSHRSWGWPSNVTPTMLPRLLVVDREKRTLTIYRWRVTKRRYDRQFKFTITVGKKGKETPHGLYFVESKTRKPDWRVPKDPDYSPDMWNTIIKFGTPGNPFAGGFISLSGKETGIGIHGTSFDPQVGTASSHGCIRMRTEDFLKIYDRVAVGTPVYLH